MVNKREEEPTPEEEAGVKQPVETSILEEPTLTVEDDTKTLTPTEFVESLAELKDKAKAAGIRPIQNMVTSYLSQGLAMVDGLLESLEGKKKKGK
jgi:effector-binding domain-containing protein